MQPMISCDVTVCSITHTHTYILEHVYNAVCINSPNDNAFLMVGSKATMQWIILCHKRTYQSIYSGSGACHMVYEYQIPTTAECAKHFQSISVSALVYC